MAWSEKKKTNRAPLGVEVDQASSEPTEHGKPFEERPENPRHDTEAGAKGVSKTEFKSSHLLVTELSFIASCCTFHSG